MARYLGVFGSSPVCAGTSPLAPRLTMNRIHAPLSCRLENSSCVDTLFKVNQILLIFLLSGASRNGIESRVIERHIVFQHAVDRMEQFAHDRTDRL